MHNIDAVKAFEEKLSAKHKLLNMRGAVVIFLMIFLLQGISAQEAKTDSTKTKAATETQKPKEAPKVQKQSKPKKPKVTPLEGQGDLLKNQFDYIITKTERFQEYQVVKRSLLYRLKANSLDTIKTLKSEIVSLKKNVNDLNSKLESLQKELTDTRDKLNTITNEKDSLRLLGILVSKSTFYVIILSIIIGLIVALAVVFILYKRSNIITVKTKETLENTQQEFEKHRKWALEKEQKLSRELLKEKQKNKGVL